MLDFPVDLGQRFFAAHGENRVPEADEDPDQRDRMRQAAEAQPAQGFRRKRQIGMRRQWREMSAPHPNGQDAPGNHHDHHHGGHVHDPQRFPAGLRNPLDILPPKINCDGDRKDCRGGIDRKSQIDMQTTEQLVQKSCQILARGDAADGSGQDIVEHQRGYGKFRERAAHGLFDDTIHTAAHEHAAALDIHGSHGIGEQHDGQNEPGSSLADGLLGDRARVEGGRSEVIEYDGGRPPKGNEGKHGGRRHHDFRKSGFLSRIGRLLNLVCRHICLDW